MALRQIIEMAQSKHVGQWESGGGGVRMLCFITFFFHPSAHFAPPLLRLWPGSLSSASLLRKPLARRVEASASVKGE